MMAIMAKRPLAISAFLGWKHYYIHVIPCKIMMLYSYTGYYT